MKKAFFIEFWSQYSSWSSLIIFIVLNSLLFLVAMQSIYQACLPLQNFFAEVFLKFQHISSFPKFAICSCNSLISLNSVFHWFLFQFIFFFHYFSLYLFVFFPFCFLFLLLKTLNFLTRLLYVLPIYFVSLLLC